MLNCQCKWQWAWTVCYITFTTVYDFLCFVHNINNLTIKVNIYYKHCSSVFGPSMNEAYEWSSSHVQLLICQSTHCIRSSLYAYTVLLKSTYSRAYTHIDAQRIVAKECRGHRQMHNCVCALTIRVFFGFILLLGVFYSLLIFIFMVCFAFYPLRNNIAVSAVHHFSLLLSAT